MRLPSILLLFLCAFSLSACFDIEEEIWIEADGSGRSEYTLDLSQMHEFLMDRSTDELNKVDEKDNASATDSIKGKMAELFKTGELDTIFSIASLMEENGTLVQSLIDTIERKKSELTEEQADFLLEGFQMIQQMQFHIQLSKKDGIVRVSAIQSFRNVEDRFLLGHFIDRFKELSTGEGNLLNSDSISKNLKAVEALAELSSGVGVATIDKRIFHYHKPGMDWSELSEDKEQLALMKMFLQNGSYRIKVHFPGKVKKIIKGDGVEKIDKQTITLEQSLSDLFDPDKQIEIEVKFKGLKK